MLLSLVALAVLAPEPAAFVVTPPALVIELDAGQIHGAPIQLSWSPDSSGWYLETLEGDGPSAKRHRFELAVGQAPRPLDAAPAWAVDYWAFKSNRAVPSHPRVLIDVAEGKRTGTIPTQSLREKANGISDGAIALRGAQEASNDFANAARVLTLTVDRVVISQLVDEPLVPGMTFGWSPTKYDSVAFRNERRHGLSILHMGGPALDVAGTKDVLLPAWSPDGTRIAFLEQTGRKKWALRQVTVSLP